ncbi:BON domain-containing protein [Hymenobacter sp. CRA2]|uniref:BON domain-containing protein n=1 Tax=Hymenobacter sp. CRA2 TaxID=1955620 RepID=UPI00098FF336|nr:BON domain-containing protein [Hymenobacter sp. CRA2]OON69955.1 hypothetical protein B0919_04190 [Hymenobacter sp. CRA2]
MQCPDPTTAAEQLTDQDITRAVELLFLTKKGVTSQLLEVGTRDGIVELAGLTNNLLARERAEAIAKEVRGVRGVVNTIVVRTQPVSDAELLRAVRQTLQDHAVTADYPIQCQVQQGAVMVTGTVRSWAEQQLALQLLKGIRGVQQVHDQLLVQPQPGQPPAHLLPRLRALLEWDVRLKSDLVSLRRDNATVHVSGTVGTPAEREQVIGLAYAAGAAHVEADNLAVADWARDKQLRLQRFVPKADADIERAVRDVLHLDARVQPFAATVIVNVRHGQVTLFGTVGHLLAHDAAAQDAGNVIGVVAVQNLLQIRAHYLAPDAVTRQQVAAALARDAYVGHYAFLVAVHDGKVRLDGTVPSYANQARAAEVAAGIRGVAAVENYVAVQQAPRPGQLFHVPEPDAALAERIRSHFFWSARLHDQEINVQVRDGQVTLSGTADTRLDREQAAEEALLCGAREVRNHLHLAYAP